jgi:hypothetical protein
MPMYVRRDYVTAQENKKIKMFQLRCIPYGSDFINKQGTFEYDALSGCLGFQVQIQSVNNPGSNLTWYNQ